VALPVTPAPARHCNLVYHVYVYITMPQPSGSEQSQGSGERPLPLHQTVGSATMCGATNSCSAGKGYGIVIIATVASVSEHLLLHRTKGSRSVSPQQVGAIDGTNPYAPGRPARPRGGKSHRKPHRKSSPGEEIRPPGAGPAPGAQVPPSPPCRLERDDRLHRYVFDRSVRLSAPGAMP
jgi:hypothetical protein